MTDEYYDVNGDSVCANCRTLIAELAESPRGASVIVRAGLVGVGAAVLGAILYYVVIAITNFEIGLVAIAMGFMVGYAVRAGARGRGGRRFQVLALLLTYWSIGLAYTPLAFGTASDPAPEGPGADAAEGPGSVGLGFAVAATLGITLALPVLVVVGSLPSGLISAAIIAFGMHQAWRMTGVPTIQISGPYRRRPDNGRSVNHPS